MSYAARSIIVLGKRMSAIRQLWDDHWKAVLVFWALVVVLVWGLALTQPHKLEMGFPFADLVV
jgi:hypothetical protein